MKQKLFFCSVLFMACTFYTKRSFSQTDTINKSVAFVSGIGIVSGKDYAATLKERDVVGYKGWFAMELGARVHAVGRLSIYPNVKLLLKRIVAFGGYESDNIDLVLTPGVAAHFIAWENRKLRLFAEGGIGHNICSGDFVEFTSAGITKQASVGFYIVGDYKSKGDKVLRQNLFGIKFGMMWVPTRFTGENTKKEFGGYSITLCDEF